MSSLEARNNKDVDKNLQCSICWDEYKSPKQLPCLHTFCLGCLEKYCDPLGDDQIPCPLCRRKFSVPEGGVDKFSENAVVARLVHLKECQRAHSDASICEPCNEMGERNVADAYCRDCLQSFCQRCKTYHGKLKATKDHKFVGIDEKPTEDELMSRYCETHNYKEIELYCCDCKSQICIMCHATAHSKHVCKALHDIAEEKKKLCQTNEKRVESCLIAVNDQKQKLMQEKEDFLQLISSTESAARQSIGNIRCLLDLCEEEILKELINVKTNRLKEIEGQRESQELREASLNSFRAYSSLVLQQGTDFEIINVADELNKRAEELINNTKGTGDSGVLSNKQLKFIKSSTPTQEEIQKLVGKIAFKDTTSSRLTSRSTCEIIENYQNNNDNELVRGVTVVGEEIFVVRDERSQVNVYDSRSLRASRDINIPDMRSPVGLAGCAYNRALYIIDEELKCIHRVDLTDNSVTRWKMRENHEPWGLSVTAEHTLLLTVQIRDTEGESRLVEYTSEGQQVREIRFARSIDFAWHTVQLSSDQFIVSHGRDFSLHRVCVINAEGLIIKSFGRERGGGKDQLSYPESLAIDEKSKHVFVADKWNSRVLMLDSELMTCLGEVHLSRDLTYPYRLYFDSSTDRLFVAEDGYRPRLFVVTRPELRN